MTGKIKGNASCRNSMYVHPWLNPPYPVFWVRMYSSGASLSKWTSCSRGWSSQIQKKITLSRRPKLVWSSWKKSNSVYFGQHPAVKTLEHPWLTWLIALDHTATTESCYTWASCFLLNHFIAASHLQLSFVGSIMISLSFQMKIMPWLMTIW